MFGRVCRCAQAHNGLGRPGISKSQQAANLGPRILFNGLTIIIINPTYNAQIGNDLFNKQSLGQGNVQPQKVSFVSNGDWSCRVSALSSLGLFSYQFLRDASLFSSLFCLS